MLSSFINLVIINHMLLHKSLYVFSTPSKSYVIHSFSNERQFKRKGKYFSAFNYMILLTNRIKITTFLMSKIE